MSGWNWIPQLEELRRSGRPVAVVTVIACTGSTPREVGAKMLVTSDAFFGTIGGGHLEELAMQDARRALGEGRSAATTVRYPLGAKTGQCCGGIVDLMIEPVNVGPRLYLFGAGHVGQAVARTLQGTPFTIHVIDERGEWVDKLPDGVLKHAGEWDDFVRDATWDAEQTYVAVMTHRHDVDQAIVEKLVLQALPVRYLGLIGSRGKWERFKQRWEARGPQAMTDEQIARVRCPLGLDTGGKAPQEVAISLAAELLQIHYGRA